ncbi:hypothetical protein [Undibacterium fentianense]|uniref:Uncharacterized protein n=1 Tax=Undibacterium fentianense TaxID=2828728 RepID=A0A941E0T1_9BURK|nr:hypothetical protein [Undibacterium fentianense]MBR7801114.1 hypothetical protein [Undibacterium fentianense]
MHPTDPKYVASNRPVNRRTTSLPKVEEKPLNPTLKNRITSLRAKHVFGLSLSDQLKRRTISSASNKVNSTQILNIFCLTFSVLGLVLAAIQHSFSIAMLASLGLLICLIWMGIARARHRSALQYVANSTFADEAMFFDELSLLAFDKVIEKLSLAQCNDHDQIAQSSSQLGESFATLKSQLLAIKAQFIQIHELTQQSNSQMDLPIDDKFYLNECLRRYLPDSLESYLQVPADIRNTKVIENGKTALDLLLQQLHLLQMEIEHRAEQLRKNAAAHLLRQQRFLEAKSRESQTIQ